jgi:hypothetical protein
MRSRFISRRSLLIGSASLIAAPYVARAGSISLLDAGKVSGGGGGGTLSLVGSCKSGGAVSPASMSLTTTAPAQISLFFSNNSRSPINQTVSDAAGLTWSVRASNGLNLVEWTAFAPAPLTGDVISFGLDHPGGDGLYCEAVALAVGGSAGFDPNGALPDAVTSGALTLSTTNLNTFLMAAFRGGGPISSAAQSGITVPDPNGNDGAIGDAITA